MARMITRREFVANSAATATVSLLGRRLCAAVSQDVDAVAVKITYEGTPPEPKILDCSSDPICARMFRKEPLRDEAVVVGKTSGLQNVFVYVSEGLPDKSWPVPDRAVTLDQNCMYIPHVFGVMAGQTLRIANSSKTLEVPHLFPRENQEQSFKLSPGDHKDILFSKPEMSVRVKCDVHPWELAYGHVMPHPFYAVTDEQGTCTIQGLVAGDYQLAFWHEKLGVFRKRITVEAGKMPLVMDVTSREFRRRKPRLRRTSRPSS